MLSATVEGYDFEEAVELAEDISLRAPWSDDRSRNQFAELRSGLYQNWITLALDQGNIIINFTGYDECQCVVNEVICRVLVMQKQRQIIFG